MLMKEKNLSLREVAEILNIPKSTLHDWRSGAAPKDFEAIHRLANFFNVSIAFLLTGSEEAGRDSAPIHAVFRDGGIVFDGYAHITIKKLLPRQKSAK